MISQQLSLAADLFLDESDSILSLFEQLSPLVDAWRAAAYGGTDYPAIAEIFDWARIPADDAGRPDTLRYLRPPQLQALETYWYLRLVQNTPHIFELYTRVFPQKSMLRKQFCLTQQEIIDFAGDYGFPALWDRIKTDDKFVADYKLEALRETLTLDYPSYILALAMGAGKTMLIGAIIATEFAMALEYPAGPFVQNALVFAPGLTIVHSLRQLSEIAYDQILPPRLCSQFLANVKLLFTRDGEKGIPVIAGSLFNIVVTNTEKIRIQKTQIRNSAKLGSLKLLELEEQAAETANRRLTDIASLPHLGVFSDEAHHTYGQEVGKNLKRVRQTVDYLHQNTNVICVINTTGTPYYQKQPLRDVVVWYGLSRGIADGILKEVADNIKGYEFESHGVGPFVQEIVTDFFKDYKDVQLPTGHMAKIALYFPQQEDLDELHPFVELAVTQAGLAPTAILTNTSKSSAEELARFNRLNEPGSADRVILLVNKGTEGWNCPSLFACALVRKLSSANNFVLQAATRCLRQVSGNTNPARIYLTYDNRKLLDSQLKENFGEGIEALNMRASDSQTHTLTLRKHDLPSLCVTQTRKIVARREGYEQPLLSLSMPNEVANATLTVRTYRPAISVSTAGVLQQVGERVDIAYATTIIDARTAAADLAAVYRLPIWPLYAEIKRVYRGEDVPEAHMGDLAAQIESQISPYEEREEQFEIALALLRPHVFRPADDGSGDLVTQISVPRNKEKLLFSFGQTPNASGQFGFHYSPYNLDSNPEFDFLEQMLSALKTNPDDVNDIYFTGGFTDPGNTEFYVEYQDPLGKWRTYTPDFLIHRKDGRWMLVEVKASKYKTDPVDGRDGAKARAARRWADMSPGQIKYEIFFAEQDVLTPDEIQAARLFIEERSRQGAGN